MCYSSTNLELEHLKPFVSELKEGQRSLHNIQRVDHVACHVSSAEVTSWYCTQLQKGIQDARENLQDTVCIKRSVFTACKTLNFHQCKKRNTLWIYNGKYNRVTFLSMWSCCITMSSPEQSQPDGHLAEPLRSRGRPAPPSGGRGFAWGRLWVLGLQVGAPPAKVESEQGGTLWTALQIYIAEVNCGWLGTLQ